MDGETDPEAVRENLDDGESPLLVDVRQPDDFAAGHIEGSENVPLPDLPGEIDRIADADHVVTVCPHGLASVKAARIIGAYRDFDGTVESMAGGLEAWDGPLAAADPDETRADTDGAPDAPF